MKEVQPPKKPILFYYLIALVVLLLLNALLFPKMFSARVTEVDYGEFLSMVESGQVGQVEIKANEIIFSDKGVTPAYYRTGTMNDTKLIDRL